MAVKLNLRERLMPILVEAVQVAGGQLADQLQVDVDHECPEFHGGKGGHSLPDQIPFKETGAGQESIGIQHTEMGVRVGVASIPDDKLPPNHLLRHDPGFGDGVRPWLSTWKERHWDAFRDTLVEVVQDRIKATA